MQQMPNLSRDASRTLTISLLVTLLSVAGVPLFDVVVVAAPLRATSPTLGAAA